VVAEKSHLACSGSLEGLYFCVASSAGQVTNKSKPGFSRHLIIRNSSLHVLMQRGQIGPTIIPLLRHFLFFVAYGSLWIGFSSVDAHTLADHFVQFTYSAGGLRARRSFLQLI
jgi:hypothetical protein